MENSKLKEVNDAFVQRYYGEAGQERFLNDLEKGSTYVKAIGVGVGVAGAMTGQPELVAAGSAIYNVGDRMEETKLIIESTKDISKGNWNNISYNFTYFVAGQAMEKAASLQNTNKTNQLLFNYSKDLLLDKTKNNNSNSNSK